MYKDSLTVLKSLLPSFECQSKFRLDLTNCPEINMEHPYTSQISNSSINEILGLFSW